MKKKPQPLFTVTFAFPNVYSILENFHLHFIFMTFDSIIIEEILNWANFYFSIYLKKNPTTYHIGQILDG